MAQALHVTSDYEGFLKRMRNTEESPWKDNETDSAPFGDLGKLTPLLPLVDRVGYNYEVKAQSVSEVKTR